MIKYSSHRVSDRGWVEVSVGQVADMARLRDLSFRSKSCRPQNPVVGKRNLGPRIAVSAAPGSWILTEFRRLQAESRYIDHSGRKSAERDTPNEERLPYPAPRNCAFSSAASPPLPSSPSRPLSATFKWHDT